MGRDNTTGTTAMATAVSVFRGATIALAAAFADTIHALKRVAFPEQQVVGSNEGLQVIGAGLSRTGTTSIYEALSMLGHRVYCTEDVIGTPGHAYRWLRAARQWKENNDLAEVNALLEEIEGAGYTSTIDFPMLFFAPAFAQLRPKAKVLMSVRDSGAQWAESWISIQKLISFMSVRPWKWVLGGADPYRLVEDFFGVFAPECAPPKLEGRHVYRPFPWFEYMHTYPAESEEYRTRFSLLHERLSREYEKIIPSHQFLKYNVKEGWGPLVAFLGLDNKFLDEPFPYLNDRKSLIVVRTTFDIAALTSPFIILGSLHLLCRGARLLVDVIRSGTVLPGLRIR